jgi:hypothetical protein
MATRTSPPNGTPCWADPWRSYVQGRGRLYGTQFKLRAIDA